MRVLNASIPNNPASLELVTNFHEFGYNYSSASARLTWQGDRSIRHVEVEPGGSYYIKPTIPHALRSNAKSEEPMLAVMRVGGALYGDAHLELSSYPNQSLGRVLQETQQWYNPTKIGG